jgi:hypothetical protein
LWERVTDEKRICETKYSSLHKNKNLTRKIVGSKVARRGTAARKLRKKGFKLQNLQDKAMKTCKNAG